MTCGGARLHEGYCSIAVPSYVPVDKGRWSPLSASEDRARSRVGPPQL